MAQLVHDFVGRDTLGIEHEFYAHLLEQQLVLGRQELFVVDPGDYLPGSEMLCQKGAHDVHLLQHGRVHGDEQVGLSYSCVAKDADGCGVTLNAEDIRICREILKASGVVVDNGDLVAFASEHFCQMGAYLSRALDDYFHMLKIFLSRYLKTPSPFWKAAGMMHIRAMPTGTATGAAACPRRRSCLYPS